MLLIFWDVTCSRRAAQSSATWLFHEYLKLIFKNMKLNFRFDEIEFRLREIEFCLCDIEFSLVWNWMSLL